MKKLAALLLVLAMIFSLAACGKKEEPVADAGNDIAAADTASDEKVVLYIATQEEIEGADVQQVTWTTVVHNLIYTPLIYYSEDLTEMYPEFCESFEITDEYASFTLPADAKFSNGDPCDAQAVYDSIMRYLEISPYASDYDSVESFEVVDDLTIKFNLKEPAPYMWAAVASNYAGINNVAVAEEMGDAEFNLCPVTNGPFYVVEWEQGSQITLARNPYFQTSNPSTQVLGNVDEVVVRFIPDEFTRVSELESGNIDIIYSVPTTSVADLKENPDITLYSSLDPGVTFVYLQTEKDVTADIAVREAIAHAVNREELVDVLDGVVTASYGYLSKAQAGYSQDAEDYVKELMDFDPDKSAQLLADAGWADTDNDGFLEKNGEKLSIEMLVASDNTNSSTCAPVLQAQLQAVGIDATIREYEASYIKQLTRDDDYVFSFRSYSWSDADIMYSSFSTDGGYKWEDPVASDYMIQARHADMSERADLYFEAEKIIADNYKAVALYNSTGYIAMKSNIDGIVVTLDGREWFYGVSKN